MKKVYQRIIDKDKGDCMRAALASMFEMELEEVPYIHGEDWWKQFYKFLDSVGYDYNGVLHNKKHSILWMPKDGCFEKSKWHRPSIMTPKALHKLKGVNGTFFASVLSPNYFNLDEGRNKTHAVVIDKDYNILHDPNPQYQNILQYPYKSLIGYDGIVNVYLIEPK